MLESNEQGVVCPVKAVARRVCIRSAQRDANNLRRATEMRVQVGRLPANRGRDQRPPGVPGSEAKPIKLPDRFIGMFGSGVMCREGEERLLSASLEESRVETERNWVRDCKLRAVSVARV